MKFYFMKIIKYIPLLFLIFFGIVCKEQDVVREPAATDSALNEKITSVNYCFIEKVDSVITLDVIEFFTGNEASKAFKYDNPNLSSDENTSFYIRNTEKKILSFPFSDTLLIKMQTLSNDEEGNFVINEEISLMQLRSLFTQSKYKHYKNIPFKVTLNKSVITGIEEQYIP